MLRLLLTFLLLPVFTSLFAQPAKKKANQANSPDMWVTSPVPELPAGVTHHTFRSESMKREVGYCLYLPPGYEKDTQRRYPVIDLHGTGGNGSHPDSNIRSNGTR
jgi:hypothetical protein|uniref:hypothetical protein n=1 Tax=Prosthecobacter sp. TaxID=1965333 RepID=UPI00378456E0